MPIQAMQFNPLSWEQSPGYSAIQGLQAGQQAGAKNLQQAFAPQLAMNELKQKELATAISNLNLQGQQQYKLPQMAAQVEKTKQEAAQAGGAAAHSYAGATKSNVGTTSDLINMIKQAQFLKMQQANANQPTDQIDATIANLNGLLQQSGQYTGFQQPQNGQMPQQGAQPSQQMQQQGGMPQQGLPLNPMQQQKLQGTTFQGNTPQAVAQPGALNPDQLNRVSQFMTQNGQQQPAQQEKPTPQDLYQQRLKQQQNNLLLAQGSGDPNNIASAQALLHNAQQGDPIVQGLNAEDAKVYSSANEKNKMATLQDERIARYEKILGEIKPFLFKPGVNLKNQYFEPRINELKQLAQGMIATQASLQGLNTNVLTGNEYANIDKVTANPTGQFLDSIKGQLENMKHIDRLHEGAFSTIRNEYTSKGNLSHLPANIYGTKFDPQSIYATMEASPKNAKAILHSLTDEQRAQVKEFHFKNKKGGQ